MGDGGSPRDLTPLPFHAKLTPIPILESHHVKQLFGEDVTFLDIILLSMHPYVETWGIFQESIDLDWIQNLEASILKCPGLGNGAVKLYGETKKSEFWVSWQDLTIPLRVPARLMPPDGPILLIRSKDNTLWNNHPNVGGCQFREPVQVRSSLVATVRDPSECQFMRPNAKVPSLHPSGRIDSPNCLKCFLDYEDNPGLIFGRGNRIFSGRRTLTTRNSTFVFQKPRINVDSKSTEFFTTWIRKKNDFLIVKIGILWGPFRVWATLTSNDNILSQFEWSV